MTTTQENGRASILVVEEDRLVLGSLTKVLQQAGYNAVQASSGPTGLQMISQSVPDLALIGVALPGMSGIELSRFLQDAPVVPYLFLAGTEEVELIRQAHGKPALGFLWKPLEVRQVLLTVEAALASVFESRELRRSETALTYALNAEHETNIAVGILMERYRLNRKQAFEILRGHARSQRRKISSVAAELITASQMLNMPYAQAESRAVKFERRAEPRRNLRAQPGPSAEPLNGDLTAELNTELTNSTP